MPTRPCSECFIVALARIVVIVGRHLARTENVVEPAGHQQAREGAGEGKPLLPFVFVEGGVAKAGRRVPADGAVPCSRSSAMSRARSTSTVKRSPLPVRNSSMPHAALDAVAERHQPTPANCDRAPERSATSLSRKRSAVELHHQFAIRVLDEGRDVDAHDRGLDGQEIGVGDGALGDDLAAPHHDDAVGDLEDVVDVVGDEEHGVAGVAHLLDEAQHAVGLLDAEIVGRLVEDDHLGGELHGARDGDRLALAARQRAHASHRRRASWRCRRARARPGAEPRSFAKSSGAKTPSQASLTGSRPRNRLRAIDRSGASEVSWWMVSMPRSMASRAEADRHLAGRARRSSPRSTGKTPEIALMSVDLPAPLSPSRATTSPS